jgi:hypothetical protein
MKDIIDNPRFNFIYIKIVNPPRESIKIIQIVKISQNFLYPYRKLFLLNNFYH